MGRLIVLGLACLAYCAMRIDAFVLQHRVVISAGSRPEMAWPARAGVCGNDFGSGRARIPANAFDRHPAAGHVGAQGGVKESWAAYSKRRQSASSHQMTGLVQGTGTSSLGGTQTGGDGITTDMALYSVSGSALFRRHEWRKCPSPFPALICDPPMRNREILFLTSKEFLVKLIRPALHSSGARGQGFCTVWAGSCHQQDPVPSAARPDDGLHIRHLPRDLNLLRFRVFHHSQRENKARPGSASAVSIRARQCPGLCSGRCLRGHRVCSRDLCSLEPSRRSDIGDKMPTPPPAAQRTEAFSSTP